MVAALGLGKAAFSEIVGLVEGVRIEHVEKLPLSVFSCLRD